MDEKEVRLLEGLSKREDWEELKKDVHVRLKNDVSLVKQRLKILELCDTELLKFPEEKIEAPEAEEAIKEIEELTKDD